MSYKLFIDDERQAFDDTWKVVRTVKEAISHVVCNGHPEIMSLDHDLGGDSTIMDFLKWYSEAYYHEGPPPWQVHSANPVGRMNIIGFLRSWEKSLK